MSEIVTYVMSLDQARRITERIRIQATNVRDGLEKLQEYVDAAKAGKAWEVLGYKSWTAYLADVMGDEPLRLSRDERREVVELLAGEGMSTRAIAPIVGVTQQRVSQLQREVTSDLSRVSSPNTSGTAPSAPTPEPVHITGLDGKTYQRPSAERPTIRRTPLPDTFNSALLNVERALKTLHSITLDDRWSTNKNQIADRYGSDLVRALDLLHEVEERLGN